MKTTLKILKSVTDKRLLKEYSEFLRVKSMFKNSCFFESNNSSYSKKAGVSRTKAKRCVGIFLRERWCRIHSGNLIFCSHKEIHENEFNVTPTHVIKVDSKEDIQIELLKNKDRQIKFVQKAKADLSYPKDLSALKRAKKLFKGERPYVTSGISMKSMSKVFNVSSSSCCNMINKLCVSGRVKKYKRRQVLGRPCFYSSIKEKYGSAFLSGCWVVRNLPSTFEFFEKRVNRENVSLILSDNNV